MALIIAVARSKLLALRISETDPSDQRLPLARNDGIIHTFITSHITATVLALSCTKPLECRVPSAKIVLHIPWQPEGDLTKAATVARTLTAQQTQTKVQELREYVSNKQDVVGLVKYSPAAISNLHTRIFQALKFPYPTLFMRLRRLSQLHMPQEPGVNRTGLTDHYFIWSGSLDGRPCRQCTRKYFNSRQDKGYRLTMWSPSSTFRSRKNARTTKEGADNRLLARLGYKPEFRREFSLVETIAFAFSIMGVCSALSATFVFPLVAAGHVGMTFGWLVPSLFVLCIASSLAELTSSMPTSAGIYYFAAKLAPEQHMPLISWIAGWSNVTGQIALLCSIEFTAAQMVTTAIAVGTDGNINLGAAPTYGIMLAFIFSHAIACSAATRVIARMTFVYAFVYVGTTIGAAIALLVVSRNNGVKASDAFGLLENNTGWPNNGWAFFLSFSDAMWTLTGYDAAAHIAEEVSGAALASPIAMVVGVAATEVLGFFLLIAMSFSTTSVKSLLGTTLSLPAGQLFLDAFGKKGMLVLWSVMISIQWINGVTQGIDASRVTFALARDNGLPGSRWLKKVSPLTATPVNAVWFVMLLSAVIGLCSFSATALASLSGATVVGLYSSYAIPIFLRVTTGRSKFKPGPFSLGRFSVPIGIIAVSYCLFVVILMSFPLTQTIRQASDMNYTVVIVAAVFIFSALSWIISARRWFTGPVPNVEPPEEEVKSDSVTEKEAEVIVKSME